MKLSRKDFLIGFGGTALGLPLGVWCQRTFWSSATAPIDTSSPRAPAPVDTPSYGIRSFSQCGEDIVASHMLRRLRIRKVTYLDIGAFHPIKFSNTYLFYLRGHRGVLVEPNVTLCEQLRKVRPQDKVLTAGIGVATAEQADYYVMSAPAWNTFSKEEAEHQQRVTNGRVFIKEVIKMPLININEVMATHFTEAPTFVSNDAEGLHLAILKSIDYARFRPKVICVETLITGTTRPNPEISEFMTSQGYVDRGGSLVNTIFVDSQIL